MHLVFDARVIQDHFPGIGRYAFNLLAELPGHLRDDEHLTAFYDPRAPNARFAAPESSGAGPQRVRWIEYRQTVFSMRNVLHTPAATHTADVVHYPYYVRPRASHPPSLTTIYDAIPFIYPRYVPSPAARLSIQLLHQIAIGASRAIITISRCAADDLARLFPASRDKIVVTPLAPDPAFTPQPAAAIAEVRAKLGLPEQFALYLGSNKPHKNLETLVEAWRMTNEELRASSEDSTFSARCLTLVVAGQQDPRYPQAQQRVKKLGLEPYVRFVGAVSDAESAALYSACALFVYPSLYEGFGLTPLEAMACGAPVACSNTSSLPEVVGDAALLFDPMKPAEIASACLRILRDDDLRDHMCKSSLTQAGRFTWQETARLTSAIYREVARTQGRRGDPAT